MILTILPSVPIWKDSKTLIFDRKFYDGILKYCELWPGHIRCIMRNTSQDLPDFGIIRLENKNLPFEIIIVDRCKDISYEHIANSNTILASADNHELLHISSLCHEQNIRCIYIIEYTLTTRLQIVALQAPTFLHRIRSSVFVIRQEYRRIKAFSLAAGIQANGVPTYRKYSSIQGDDLLYFDNRVESAEIIGNAQLERRLGDLPKNKPLRLAFSGRLTKIKGADDLLKVAELLSNRGINFVLTIYGSGDLIQQLETTIINKNLTDKVILTGAVNFHSILLPALKDDTDIFICLHKQGDPSCTYLETLSCGLPIVGYDNEAFKGILDTNDIGWSAPINKVIKIADILVHLHRNRHLMPSKAYKCVETAKNNDFQKTFERRVNHLIKQTPL